MPKKAKTPEARYQTLRNFDADIRRILSGHGDEVRTQSTTMVDSNARRLPFALLISTIVLLAWSVASDPGPIGLIVSQIGHLSTESKADLLGRAAEISSNYNKPIARIQVYRAVLDSPETIMKMSPPLMLNIFSQYSRVLASDTKGNGAFSSASISLFIVQYLRYMKEGPGD